MTYQLSDRETACLVSYTLVTGLMQCAVWWHMQVWPVTGGLCRVPELRMCIRQQLHKGKRLPTGHVSLFLKLMIALVDSILLDDNKLLCTSVTSGRP